MAATFRLTIAAVDQSLFDGEAESVTLPGTAGEMTILANHEPIISTLKGGTITVRTGSNESKQFPVEKGMVECSTNHVTVLL